MKSSKLITWLPFILLAAIILTSCAPGNEKFDIDPAGFWAGLWHGLISLITFIISLFNNQIGIYEVNNSGWPYNLGFILGVMFFYGGSFKSSCKKWK